MSKTILKRSLALGLNLELIWVRPLVFTQINQGQQNAGVILKIIKKKRLLWPIDFYSCDGQSHQQLRA